MFLNKKCFTLCQVMKFGTCFGQLYKLILEWQKKCIKINVRSLKPLKIDFNGLI